MQIEIDNQLFEWNDDKAALNVIKHGVYFEDAALVFNDRNRIEKYDLAHSVDEDRWLTIGMVNSILCVIYTERGEATRLISARKATPQEKREYYDHQKIH